MLEIVNLGKEYEDKVALDGVSLSFPNKGLVIIKGESGSGKTTLLNLLTAHDTPTSGKIIFHGAEINSKNSEKYRRSHCSNIYQDYMLIEDMTVGDNIELALQAYGEEYTQSDVIELLTKVGISEEYISKQASKLSGGEKQRVSIARAIAKKQAMIFADEPTGNLDSQNGEMIMEILKDISKERLVVVVSHNEVFNVKYADYTIELVDGVVESCDLPQVDKEETKQASFERKSKLKAKTLIKLTAWGFKKNKARAVVSIVAFVILCILSTIFFSMAFADINLSSANSIDNCEKRNVITVPEMGSLFNQSNVEKFESRVTCAEVFRGSSLFSNINVDMGVNQEYCKQYQIIKKEWVKMSSDIYHDYYGGDTLYYPIISCAILYNPAIGVDVDVLYGDFPKEYNEVMLPYCYLNYLSQVLPEYKVDDVKDFIGREIKYEGFGGYFTYKICGIFDEGPYFTDFDKPQDARIVNYYYDSNVMAQCAIFSSDMKEIASNNPDIFNRDYMSSLRVKFNNEYPEGRLSIYDRFSDYSKTYAPLEVGEVYLDEKFAQLYNIKVGDRLANTCVLQNGKSIDGFSVKGIFDLPNKQNFIIVNKADYDRLNGKDSTVIPSGFYFNMSKTKNVYSALNKIKKVGFDEGIWYGDESGGNIDHIDTGNSSYTYWFYRDVIYQYRYFIYLPLAVVLLIGLAIMGFIATGFLISSKGDAYNIMRSLGFDKKNVLLILAVQVFLLILLGVILGICCGALGCHLISRLYLMSKIGSGAKFATEVILPMGFIAPIVVSVLSLLVGIAVVAIKAKVLFSKTIIENRQEE